MRDRNGVGEKIRRIKLRRGGEVVTYIYMVI
jgi:hypothetical protein